MSSLTIPLLLTLLLILPSTGRLDSKCSLLQLDFASASTGFTTCIGKNTKPVHICLSCSDAYRQVSHAFGNITHDTDCSAALLDSDNAMVIRRLWDAYGNMWGSALCSTCSGLSVNRSLEFINRTNQVLDCFTTNKPSPSLICTECDATYNNLLELFKSFYADGYACADLADSMNTTSHTWSVRYRCGHPKVEYATVLSLTGGIIMLPVLFYLALEKIPYFS